MLPVDPIEAIHVWKQLHAITTSDISLIRLAFRARKKLGLRSVSDLRRAVGGISRQLIYRTLTKGEIEELQQ